MIKTRSDTLKAVSLRAAFIRGVGWAGLARALAFAFSMFRYVVFARLLDPRDFGVVGAAASAMGLLSSLTSPSFGQALIQRDDDVEPYLDTVFTAGVVRGVVISVLMFAAARPLAVFFKQPNNYAVFWALAPFMIIYAMQSPGVVVYYRRLDFRIMLALNAAELTTAFGVGLIAILYWRDWRGLVAGMLAGQAVRAAVTHCYFPYRPRLRFDLPKAHQLFAFGRWMTAQGVAALVARDFDNLAVAHLLGPAALGEYQMAFRAGELPAGEFAHSMGMVSFPLSARLRGRPRERRRAFAAICAIVFAVGGGYAATMFFWGPDIVRLVFGPRWLGALPPLQFLALYGLFQGLLTVGGYFLDGMGAPKASFQVTIVRALTLMALVLPMTLSGGTRGTAAAGLISVAVPLPLMLAFFHRAQSLEAAKTEHPAAAHPHNTDSRVTASSGHGGAPALAADTAAPISALAEER